jgi:hypothetical protein
MSLDLSHRDLFYGTDGIVIKVLICSHDFFLIFPLSSLIVVICEQRVRERRKKKKKDLKSTPKLQ